MAASTSGNTGNVGQPTQPTTTVILPPSSGPTTSHSGNGTTRQGQGQGQGHGGSNGAVVFGSPTIVIPQTAASAALKATRSAISNIVDRQGIPPRNKVKLVTNHISHHEIVTLGSLFIKGDDGFPYYFDAATRVLYRMDLRNEEFLGAIFERYGLLATELFTKHVVTALICFTLRQAPVRRVRRFSFYDTVEQALYLHGYDGTAWRLDGTMIAQVPNGAFNAVFIYDDKGVACPNVNIAYHGGILLDRLVNHLSFANSESTALTPDQQKLLLSIWIFAIAFPDLMPTKPLLLLEGNAGAGKSSCVLQIQRALHGKDRALQVGRHDEADFGVTILRSPITLIDNTDTYVEWMRDALCAYATGGSWVKRKKYTDMDEVEIRPQSFITLATKNPATFRRDDIADRCLILKLERRSSFSGMNQLLAQVDQDRPLILGEYIWLLNQVVKELRAGSAPKTTTQRMADFACMAYAVAPVLGYNVADVDAALEALQAERATLTTDGDPLVDTLDRWLSDTRNSGRKVSAAELYTELGEVAKRHIIGWRFFKTAHALSKHLDDYGPGLSKYFDIQTQIANKSVSYEIRRIE